MDNQLHLLRRLQGEIAALAPGSGDRLAALDLQQRLTALRDRLVGEQQAIRLKLDTGRLRRHALVAYGEFPK
ncbi:MAG: hypothetical protein P0Y65_13945 [Candidatus Devosia phytovorans]|uniref:Uncharacterized protein n=1 Tax=Candidatus Devosia phytovorans TaxID=3121372 RepID=A0AAJ6AY84_9HYPH|nr:hypothetical protein [Devosia sp.]WEK03290.1 MAG: hypothetical protein P0Y65_13945 [Devosia sp.]